MGVSKSPHAHKSSTSLLNDKYKAMENPFMKNIAMNFTKMVDSIKVKRGPEASEVEANGYSRPKTLMLPKSENSFEEYSPDKSSARKKKDKDKDKKKKKKIKRNET